MAATRASHGDREVGLPLVHVAGDDHVQQPPQAIDEVSVLRLALHVGAYSLVRARKRPELVDPVGVGQEAHVEHQVGVTRGPVLEPERDERHLQAVLGRRLGERLADLLPELVRGQVRGVDYQIGLTPEALHHQPLLAYPLHHPVGGRERMPAAGGLVAVDQIVVGRVQVQDPVLHPCLVEILQRLRELAEEHAAARVHHYRHTGRTAGARSQLCHLGQERRREIVDHEVAQVLERVGRLRATRAGHSRDQRERRRRQRLRVIGHGLHGAGHQALTLCVASGVP